MFVKKDLRKIPVIIADAMKNNDSSRKVETPSPTATKKSNSSGETEILTELRLARRPTEFKGGRIKEILCQPYYAPALYNLVSISLYDCQICSIDGIGFFASRIDAVTAASSTASATKADGDVEMEDVNKSSKSTGSRNDNEIDNAPSSSVVCPFLEELNLGRNPIETLPAELGLLSKSLKRLWLDDCQLKGSLPECLYELDNLEVLRVSNNNVTELKGSGVSQWKALEVLCLDGNNLESIPDQIAHLKKLKSLFLRNNKLTKLPEGLGLLQNLELLHISSNQLTALQHSISQCHSLKKIYANGNKIVNIPDKFFQHMENLVSCNLSNNQIKVLPLDFVEQFGHPIVTSGICKKDSDCTTTATIILEQNPVLCENQ